MSNSGLIPSSVVQYALKLSALPRLPTAAFPREKVAELSKHLLPIFCLLLKPSSRIGAAGASPTQQQGDAKETPLWLWDMQSSANREMYTQAYHFLFFFFLSVTTQVLCMTLKRTASTNK